MFDDFGITTNRHGKCYAVDSDDCNEYHLTHGWEIDFNRNHIISDFIPLRHHFDRHRGVNNFGLPSKARFTVIATESGVETFESFPALSIY